MRSDIPTYGMAFVLLLSLVVLSGCGPRLEYEVRMRVTDSGFSRAVAITAKEQAHVEDSSGQDTSVSLPDKVRERFTKIYGLGEPANGTVRFEEEFATHPPEDLDNVGLLKRVSSDLGEGFVYHERFQGQYPTVSDQTQRRKGIDRFLEYLLRWLQAEFEGNPEGEVIYELVDSRLRDDLYDLQLLIESTSYSLPVLERAGDPEVSLQVAHFLLERGYLNADDIAHVAAEWKTTSMQRDQWWFSRLHKYLDRHLGDAVSDETLAIFKDEDRLARSLRSYLSRLPAYEQYRQEWEECRKGRGSQDPDDPPDPLDLVWKELTPFFPLLLSWERDRITLHLHLAAEPFETNGEWDTKQGAVSWQWDVEGTEDEETLRPPRMPRIAMASWAEPNLEAQTERFGEVLMTGEVLMEYCGWYQQLKPTQAEHWATLASRLPSLSHEQRVQLLVDSREEWKHEEDLPGWLERLLKTLPLPE